jgi:hypothetical protein
MTRDGKSIRVLQHNREKNGCGRADDSNQEKDTGHRETAEHGPKLDGQRTIAMQASPNQTKRPAETPFSPAPGE